LGRMRHSRPMGAVERSRAAKRVGRSEVILRLLAAETFIDLSDRRKCTLETIGALAIKISFSADPFKLQSHERDVLLIDWFKGSKPER